MSLHLVMVEVQTVLFDAVSIILVVCGGIRVSRGILAGMSRKRRGR
jgi:uncharacterized membrane protein